MTMQYVKGQFVGFVAVDIEPVVPPAAERWFMLQVMPGRDAKVIARLKDWKLSGYSPVVVTVIDRRHGGAARKPHLGRRIVKPMLPGLVFVPDYDVFRAIATMKSIGAGVEGLLRFGEFTPSLSNEDMEQLRSVEAAMNVPRGQRKYLLGEMVRIVDGPLAHFVGKIERLDSKGRLKVFIDAIKRGVSVRLNETQVEPAV
ncbi:transcription termination/antitermination NusG family protein [Bradyrhizobium elkanii]|nr:transcription termination/antitermination NusG family protein [Bradyrhizobium elkanii]